MLLLGMLHAVFMCRKKKEFLKLEVCTEYHLDF